MVENPKQMLNLGHNNPRLQSEKYNGLDDGNVETHQHPSVFSLLTQYIIQLRLFLPGITKVCYDNQPVTVSIYQEVPQVLKQQHCLQCLVINPERRQYTRPRILLHKTLSIPFQSPCAEI